MAIDPNELRNEADSDLFAAAEMIRQIIQERQQAREQAEENRVARIHDAIAQLQNLLGPDNPTKPTLEELMAGDTNIQEMRMFTVEELNAYPGLAAQLILLGMELLTRTMIDIAESR